MFDVLEIFDKQTIIYISIISVISIFLLYFIFKHAFKHSTKLRAFFLSIIVYVFMGMIGMTVYYVSQNEYIYSSVEKYHIKGKVTSIDENFIVLNVTSSNLSSVKNGKNKIYLTNKTVYSIYSNSEDIKVKNEEIYTGSNVEIICKVSNENEVVALKVTKIVY